jgi:hypothetical protein
LSNNIHFSKRAIIIVCLAIFAAFIPITYLVIQNNKSKGTDFNLDDFNFRLNFYTYGKEQIDTYKGTLTKDLVLNGTKTVKFKIPDNVKNDIYDLMMNIDIMSFPDTLNLEEVTITPSCDYELTVTMQGKTKTIIWNEGFYPELADDLPKENTDFLKLVEYIRDYTYNTDEYKNMPTQSAIEVNNENTHKMNDNDLISKIKPDENDVWEEYRSILSGNFALINDTDCKLEMEYLFEKSCENGKCEWKYVLIDFNKDGIKELFIRLNSEYDTALYRYKDGSIECIGIDSMEMNCFTQPLKDGKMVKTYYYNGTTTKTIFEYDSEFNVVNSKQYFSITVDDYEDFKERNVHIINKYPIITKEGEYYYQNIDGESKPISKEDWDQIQKYIDEQTVCDSEWNDCSKLIP